MNGDSEDEQQVDQFLAQCAPQALHIGVRAKVLQVPPLKPPAQKPNAENTPEEKLRRRREALTAGKRSAEYQYLLRLDDEANLAVALPMEPDASNIDVSKRSWERSVRKWRAAVKSMAMDHLLGPMDSD